MIAVRSPRHPPAGVTLQVGQQRAGAIPVDALRFTPVDVGRRRAEALAEALVAEIPGEDAKGRIGVNQARAHIHAIGRRLQSLAIYNSHLFTTNCRSVIFHC